jgi:cytochrome c biogenesis protein CcmG/thiol:disulfide interchange protein DsbE
VKNKNRTWMILGGVIVLVALAAVIAVVASGGNSSSSAGASTSVPLEQVQPITPTGDPLAAYDETVKDPTIGKVAPTIDGKSFDGTPIRIGGTSDGPTLISFLAHWCPHCNREVPALVELEKKGKIPDGLNVIGVSTSPAPDRPNYPPSQWFRDESWPWPVMADDKQNNAFSYFGGAGFPFLVMLDKDGTVLARQSGESTPDQIKAWMEAVLATAKT